MSVNCGVPGCNEIGQMMELIYTARILHGIQCFLDWAIRA